MKYTVCKNKAVLMVGAVLIGLLSVMGARADDSNPWYVGLSVGQSNYSHNITSLAYQYGTEDGFAPNTGPSSKISTGYSPMAGYRFNQYFALEGDYFNMGSAIVINDMITVPTTGHNFASVKLTGFGIDAVGSLPLTQSWSLFGRLGVVGASLVDHEASVIYSSPGNYGTAYAASYKSTYDIGAGVQLNSSSNWAFRLGYTQFHDVGEIETGSGNVNYAYLSALYNF